MFKPDVSGGAARWWEGGPFLLAIILSAAIPLLWPDVPPLTDLPGHMGRYRIQLDGADAPGLRFFGFGWALIGNLGVDLLLVPLSRLLGLEGAVKLIVMAIPPLTVAGFLFVAREAHGRVPPTALFAAPLAYGYPLHFGFVNFALSMAFAFLTFGLWLRLARQGRLVLRAAIFVPLSLVLWVTHVFGWGVLGLLAASAEFVRQRDCGRRLVPATFRTGVGVLALAPPVLLMLIWRSGDVGGDTGDWFNWAAKLQWLLMAMRDRWQAFDLAALGVLAFVLATAGRSPRLGFSRDLGAAAAVLALVFILLPRIVLGSAYADMRLVPYMLGVAVLAVRGPEGYMAKVLAAAGLAFMLVRTAGTAASFALYNRDYDRQLAALNHVPVGSRVAAFVGKPCADAWAVARRDHLPALAIVRRRGFANDQWDMAGAQLLRVRYPAAGRFTADPSQLVLPTGCDDPLWTSLDRSLAELPRDAFDYVWLIGPPPYDPKGVRGLRPVWRDGTSVLFRTR